MNPDLFYNLTAERIISFDPELVLLLQGFPRIRFGIGLAIGKLYQVPHPFRVLVIRQSNWVWLAGKD